VVLALLAAAGVAASVSVARRVKRRRATIAPLELTAGHRAGSES
jgi:hypothetical protein